jgi:hypothetical protein
MLPIILICWQLTKRLLRVLPQFERLNTNAPGSVWLVEVVAAYHLYHFVANTVFEEPISQSPEL